MLRSRNPWMLLSAVITITVPGVIAVYAAVGGDASATGPGGARHGPAAAVAASRQPSGRTGTRAAASHTGAQSQGMRLLFAAAAAGLATTYQGVELVSRWSMDGTSTVMSTVWHRSGGLTMTQTADLDSVAQGSEPQVSYDADGQDPEGVFGVTKTLVGLLGAHYDVEYAGTGVMAARAALVVQVRRPDGSLAARFWLDKQTMLPLGREDYDENAEVISEDTFVSVKFGRSAIPQRLAAYLSGTANDAAAAVSPQIVSIYEKFAAQERAFDTPLASPPVPVGATVSEAASWIDSPAPAQLLDSLRGQGLRVPSVLPDGLTLYAAAQAETVGGTVVDLGYSDGLFAVSLFVQRGDLAARPGSGFEPMKVAGREVLSAGHGLIWSGRGYVYTVLADAPATTVDQVVQVLPYDAPPGFWRRLGRGLGRLASMVDPFR